MRLTLIFILICLPILLFAQKRATIDRVAVEFSAVDVLARNIPEASTTTTDKLAQYILSNFKTDKERVRAIYTWLTTHVEYDVENMYVLHPEETKEQKNLRTLHTRKGICENYAMLFTSLCEKIGIVSHLISGYTRQLGDVDKLSHAWCAAFVDQKWYLYDPTWGAGYMNARTHKFVFWVSNQYYSAAPEFLINSHIPFDYLWQFIPYPVTNKEFVARNIRIDNSRPFFNFNDSIALYLRQNELDRLVGTAIRVEKNGVTNGLILDRLRYLRERIEYIRLTATVDLYNASAIDFNDAVALYNDFIHYKNVQFTPAKTDSEIQTMIDSVDYKLQTARDKINRVEYVNSEIGRNIQQLQASVNNASKQIDEQKLWLSQYFSKTKSGRKSMFYSKRVRVMF